MEKWREKGKAGGDDGRSLSRQLYILQVLRINARMRKDEDTVGGYRLLRPVDRILSFYIPAGGHHLHEVLRVQDLVIKYTVFGTNIE